MNRRLANPLVRVGAALLALVSGCTVMVAPGEMSQVQRSIRQRYPDVRQISTEQLALWLDDTSRRPPVLLDVRAREEYAVSHLQGARHVDPSVAPARALAAVPRNTPLVVYCSVGYRSSAYARRLRAAGFTNVANLDGSIFQWANEGRPVYRADQEVAVVHPYDRRWGKLLHDDLRARP